MLLSDFNIGGMILFWRLRKKSRGTKPTPFWKGKHMIIKYTFPESGGAHILFFLWTGRVWRPRGVVPRAHFVILKSQGVWGNSLNMGGLVGKIYTCAATQKRICHIFGQSYSFEFFSPNSQDVKDRYHHKLIIFLKFTKNKPFFIWLRQFYLVNYLLGQWFPDSLPCRRKVRSWRKVMPILEDKSLMKVDTRECKFSF